MKQELAYKILIVTQAFTNALHTLENVEFKIAKDLKDILDRFFSKSDSMDLLRTHDTRSKQRSQAIAIVFSYKLLDTQRWISGGDISATFTQSSGNIYEEDKYKLVRLKYRDFLLTD